jgi:sugar lactone lactonase YvrE
MSWSSVVRVMRACSRRRRQHLGPVAWHVAAFWLGAGLIFAATAPVSRAAVVYFTNGTTVGRLAEDGTVSVFAQASGLHESGLGNTSGLAFDRSGNLYADSVDSSAIVRLAADGSQTTVFLGLDPTAKGLAIDTAGNFYVSEYL